MFPLFAEEVHMFNVTASPRTHVSARPGRVRIHRTLEALNLKHAHVLALWEAELQDEETMCSPNMKLLLVLALKVIRCTCVRNFIIPKHLFNAESLFCCIFLRCRISFLHPDHPIIPILPHSWKQWRKWIINGSCYTGAAILLLSVTSSRDYKRFYVPVRKWE